jgi:hypothetical protein
MGAALAIKWSSDPEWQFDGGPRWMCDAAVDFGFTMIQRGSGNSDEDPDLLQSVADWLRCMMRKSKKMGCKKAM